MKPGDGKALRKLAIQLSYKGSASLDFLYNVTVEEFLEIVKEVAECGKQKRI